MNIDGSRCQLGNASLASETSLGSDEKEVLFVKLEGCMNKLSKKMNFNCADLSIGQRAFVSCCHFVCDEILKLKYKWFSLEATLSHSKSKKETPEARAAYITSQNLDYCRLQFQRAIHESLSDLLDPSRIYGTNLVRKEIVENMLPKGMSTKIRGQYNMTSASVRALMGAANSPEARRFISRCEVPSYGIMFKSCAILYFLMSIYEMLLVPLPGSTLSDLKKDHIQRGTNSSPNLLPPEFTWKGVKIRSDASGADSSHSSTSNLPFSRTLYDKSYTELPLSATGKNALFSIVKDKQKGKYSGNRIGKYGRVPDVKNRTVLLDDKGDTVIGSPNNHELRTSNSCSYKFAQEAGVSSPESPASFRRNVSTTVGRN